MRQRTLEHLETNYPNHKMIYTDGSKHPNPNLDEKVGIGVYSSKSELNYNISARVSDNTAIESAELTAIGVALYQIQKNIQKGKYKEKSDIAICTDSLSAAEAIESNKKDTSRPDLVQEIHRLGGILDSKYQIKVHVIWIPSRVNITGNEMADSLAKEALN